MKIRCVLTVTREVESAGPEEGQSLEVFLREWEEATVEDPFCFIDSHDAKAVAKAEEVK